MDSSDFDPDSIDPDSTDTASKGIAGRRWRSGGEWMQRYSTTASQPLTANMGVVVAVDSGDSREAVALPITGQHLDHRWGDHDCGTVQGAHASSEESLIVVDEWVCASPEQQ